jgi:hypothetical protein
METLDVDVHGVTAEAKLAGDLLLAVAQEQMLQRLADARRELDVDRVGLGDDTRSPCRRRSASW